MSNDQDCDFKCPICDEKAKMIPPPQDDGESITWTLVCRNPKCLHQFTVTAKK